MSTAWVDLYWLPVGAGDRFRVVRSSGRVYEAVLSLLQRRRARSLYHSALEVAVGGARFVIEMAPVWRHKQSDRGVVAEGSVGLPWLGRFRAFRYEVRCWRGGIIPDLAYAVSSPRRVSMDAGSAWRVLDLVSGFPTATWGRDELDAGEMWNSNSLISWLLILSGHDMATIEPPLSGRAPGWAAGLEVGRRSLEAKAVCSPHRRRTLATIEI